MATKNTKQDSIKTVGIVSNLLTGVMGAYRYSKSGWTTEAWVIPKELINKDIKEQKLQFPGIYFLVGDVFEGNKTKDVYVGKAGLRNSKVKAENKAILGRLREHVNKTSESYYDLWNYAIAFTRYKVVDDKGSEIKIKSDWGLTEISNLENLFYHDIPDNCRLNSVEPNVGSDGSENIDYDGMVNEIKSFLIATNSGIFDESDINETLEIQESASQTLEDKAETMEDISPESRIPEFITPKKVVSMVVDELDPSVFNPKTKFLDPACKGGEFLKEIYERLMCADAVVQEFPDTIDRSIHILTKQLYGVALSSTSKDRTTRNLKGLAPNIKIIPKYIDCLKASSSKKGQKDTPVDIRSIFENEFREETGDPVKFDVVIGNPPYQENNSGGRDGMSGNTIYDKFIDMSLITADQVCMIVKDNWMSYKGLEYTRNNLIKYGLVKVIDYPIPKEVFNNVAVAVNIFSAKRGYEGPTHFIEIRNGIKTGEYNEKLEDCGHLPTCVEELAIVKKLKAHSNESFSRYVESAYPFGIKSNGVDHKGYLVSSSKTPKDDFDTPIVFMDSSNKAYYSYVRRESIYKNEDIVDHYKIICGLQLNRNSRIITNMHGLKPSHICSGSFGLLYSSADMSEALNAYKYIRTQFFRCILYWCIDTKCTVAPYRFELIPDQDFTSNSDIDWTQPIADIDKQLYKKYELTQGEIEYIENTIEPME